MSKVSDKLIIMVQRCRQIYLNYQAEKKTLIRSEYIPESAIQKTHVFDWIISKQKPQTVEK